MKIRLAFLSSWGRNARRRAGKGYRYSQGIYTRLLIY